MKDRFPGRLIVLSAVSGAGKTTVSNELVRRSANYVRSVSVATRARQKEERDGIDYLFVSEREFDEMRRRGIFLEYQKVHSHYYGTPKEFVLQNLREGKNVLLVIDTKGGLNIKKMFKEAILIFMLPPSLDALIRRLHLRGRESAEERNRRIANGKKELRDALKYDYIIVNEEIQKSVSDIDAIVRASELRAEHNIDKVSKIIKEYKGV